MITFRSTLVPAFSMLVVAAPLRSQSSGIRTYANPIDVDYRYNFEQHNQGISYRQGYHQVRGRSSCARSPRRSITSRSRRSTRTVSRGRARPSICLDPQRALTA